DGAAHRIVDGGAEERGSGGLAAGLLEVDAERLEERLGRIGQHGDPGRDGRAGVGAGRAPAGLEERPGERADALAAEERAFALPELLDVLSERPLTHAASRALGGYFCLATIWFLILS